MNKLNKLVSMAIKPARVAWSVGIIAVLAACWGGGDAPAVNYATADVIVGASNVTLAQKKATASTLVALSTATTTPITFPTGFSGTDASGAAVTLPAVPTTVSFSTNPADATQPLFKITSAAGSAEGTTVMGSCTFTILKSTFPATGPLGTIGATMKVDPCTATIFTSGQVANGIAEQRTFKVYFSSGYAEYNILTTINPDGTIIIAGRTIEVVVPVSNTTTTTAAPTTTTTAAPTTTTTAAPTTTTAAPTTTTAAPTTTTTTAAPTTTTAAPTTTTAAPTTTTTAAPTTTTAAPTTTTTTAATTTTTTTTPTTTVPDTTRPVLVAGPTITAVTGTSVTMSVTINEAGTGYYLAQVATLPAPIYNTTSASPFANSFSMSANTAATQTFLVDNGLTSYNVYFYAKDTAGNYLLNMVYATFTSGTTGSTGTTGTTAGTGTTGGSPP